MPISIEFKSGVVNIVEAKVKKYNIEVKKAYTFDFPEEWIDSTGILDMNNLVLLLEQVLKEQGFKEKQCSICCEQFIGHLS